MSLTLMCQYFSNISSNTLSSNHTKPVMIATASAASSNKLDFIKFHNVIAGKLETTATTRHGVNPSTLENNPPVPVSTIEDVDRAVEVAVKAAEAWADVPYTERQEKIAQFADGLEALKDDFALMLTKEQGKPLAVSNGEVAAAIQTLRAVSTLPPLDEVVEYEPNRRVSIEYTPLGMICRIRAFLGDRDIKRETGVAVGIVPWNFPISIAITKIGSALVTGNAFILKPSPFTPYCNLKLAELGIKYFPPGVFQALSGDDVLGPWLVAHPKVDKVSFTGSTATGKRIAESCGKTLKRVTLELGGNDPAIVCGDVDVKAVAPKLAMLAFLNSGQVCIAIKRIYVHASIYKELLGEIVKVSENLLIGDGLKEGVMLGPLQNSMQYEKVKEFLADIKSQGLKVATGARDASTIGKGYFITPTIVDNPPEDSKIVMEEPFGPILPMLSWEEEDEVLRRANATVYGLGASVWTQDLEKGKRLARKLKAGSVWFNSHLELHPNVPFGGHKQSGIGAENGIDGLKAFCNTRALYTNKE
ncbi:hypothetical protein QQX98_004077 [Neonectria punicea]|uniref:aldehyde dehydrogenase (NAD(+)) n=1 Tax=Neonectria punicea TaxID=979145 RepID=A0ABR1HBQ4_9HYPO